MPILQASLEVYGDTPKHSMGHDLAFLGDGHAVLWVTTRHPMGHGLGWAGGLLGLGNMCHGRVGYIMVMGCYCIVTPVTVMAPGNVT